jgi:hypothetical protein
MVRLATAWAERCRTERPEMYRKLYKVSYPKESYPGTTPPPPLAAKDDDAERCAGVLCACKYHCRYTAAATQLALHHCR